MSASTETAAWRRILAWRKSRDVQTALTGSVHARSGTNTVLVLALFVLASVPALVVSTWRAGLSLVLPLLLTACAVSLFWALLFARTRRRPLDPGWLMTGLIFVLLLPADIPVLLAALGMSFAAVLGHHIFGGTGRYVVSPAVLGALFIHFSYPGIGTISNTASWDAVTTMYATEGGVSWSLLGSNGSFVLSLLVACAFGAAYLAHAGAISWRTLLGGVLGVILAAALTGSDGNAGVGQLPWYWHLAFGNAPICLAFVITDPTTSSLTRGGRWLHGLLFGILLVAIRVLDPTHPEGSLFAALLATLSVPLVDYLVIRRRVALAQGGLKCRR